MLLTHEFCLCIYCGETLEIFTEDRRLGQVECPECGYTNFLDDSRLRIWEEEF